MHRKADLFDLFYLNPTPLNHPTLEIISTQTPLTRTLQIDGHFLAGTLYITRQPTKRGRVRRACKSLRRGIRSGPTVCASSHRLNMGFLRNSHIVTHRYLTDTNVKTHTRHTYSHRAGPEGVELPSCQLKMLCVLYVCVCVFSVLGTQTRNSAANPGPDPLQGRDPLRGGGML